MKAKTKNIIGYVMFGIFALLMLVPIFLIGGWEYFLIIIISVIFLSTLVNIALEFINTKDKDDE